MNDERDDLDEARPVPTRLAELLAGDAVWTEVPPGVEDAVVAAITAERGSVVRVGPVAPPATARRGARLPWRLVSVAAAAVVALAGVAFVVTRGGGDDGGVAIALTGTELAPDATATADVVDTPAGVRIVLDVDGLPGAPEGSWYEAWMRTPSGGVSAGTFHLRGGDGPIELWCGVGSASYAAMTVTIQDPDDGGASSGEVVLRGEFPG